jgi:hypothetical protein
VNDEQSRQAWLAVYAAAYAQAYVGNNRSPDNAHAVAKNVAELAVGKLQNDRDTHAWLPAAVAK